MSDYAQEITALPDNDDIPGWISSQMSDERPTLLAFADDGVIWGHWIGGHLVTGHEVDPSQPELRAKTLQQAYVFGTYDEVRLFRDEMGSWKSWQIKDDDTFITESQILWGDGPAETQPNAEGFVRLQAARKGIPDQLLPFGKVPGVGQCLRLKIHHQVAYDQETGEARITLSRLAGLSVGNKAVEA